MLLIQIFFENILLWFTCCFAKVVTFFEPENFFRWFNNNVNIFYHYFCGRIDPNDKRHGGELVASVFQSHGVKHLFTLPGGHISPIITASEKLGIRIVDTRHEVTAVFAADASARLSGIPGVAIVTAGPGVTNTVTAVKNAQMAESPIIVIGGASASLLKDRGALQDIDQYSLFRSITKKQFMISKVRDIVPLMRKAFQVAQSDTPGPVYVELPIDVLYQYSIVAKEVGSTPPGRSFQSKLVHWYLTNYLQNLFAGAFDRVWDTTPLPIQIPLPSNVEIEKSIQLITQSKKPLIILGSQSVTKASRVDELRKSIESLGIPCYLGGMSRGLLGRNGPLHMRQARREALREADLVILGGSVADFRLSYGRVFPKRANIISVNRNRDQMYKNAGIFWQPTVAVNGDPAEFFYQITRNLGTSYKVDSEWIQMLKDRDTSKESKTLEMANQPTDAHLNPLKVLNDLEETLDPEKTILVADGGDFVGSAAYILRPRGPLTWLDPGAFGTLGVGAGFAIGAKLCRPDHNVVVIFGDGSFGYSLIEFDTMVRHKLPIMAVIGNDACWTQIAREQVPMLGSDVACRLAYNDYDEAVKGLGADGYRLTADHHDQLMKVFDEAQQKTRNGTPVVVNVLIGKTKFREGSISV